MSKKHKQKSLEVMKTIIETSLKDLNNAPNIVDQMTGLANEQLVTLMEQLEESKEELVPAIAPAAPAIAPAAQNKRTRSNKPPTMMFRYCKSNDRGVVKAKA